MSALTDLFTAMANKIRSKTGTQTTYTPLEMVSDGIDDVYAAGYDAGGGGGGGGIPITPSNASPVSLTSGESYEMQANGYAISSYTNLTPSNASPVSLSDDTIYKTNGTGKAIASLSDITPSDSSPASLSSGSIYKAGGAGYAIASIATNGNGVTPSSSGQYFYSGWNRMTSAGYAYSSQPSSGYTYGWNSTTNLWSNSSPTSTFAAQDVTLSASMDNYNYLGFEYRVSTSSSTTLIAIFSVADVKKSLGSNTNPLCMGGCYASSAVRARSMTYVSLTSVRFGNCFVNNTTTNANGYVIPTRVIGYK